MSAEINNSDRVQPNYDGEALLLHGRITDLEREKAEREEDEKKYRDAQLALNRGQLSTNRWMALFTFLLVICTAITGAIAWRQATIARIAAEAAQQSAAAAQTNADVAKKTLAEMQKSGGDTHELAESAKAQSEQAKAQTRELAESLRKSDELIREAAAQSRAAQDSVKLATDESARSGERTERQLKILQDQVAASRDQAKAALSSALAIQKQTETAERPWISVEVKPDGLIFVNGQQPVLTLHVLVKNVGKSIAKHVQVDTEMLPLSPTFPLAIDAGDKQRSLCDDSKLVEAYNTDLFPSDNWTMRYVNVSVPSKDVVAKSFMPPEEKPRGFVGLYIIGCVTYRFSFGEGVGQTLFAYNVVGTLPTTHDGKPILMPVADMPGVKLSLTGFELGVNQPKVFLWQDSLASNESK